MRPSADRLELPGPAMWPMGSYFHCGVLLLLVGGADGDDGWLLEIEVRCGRLRLLGRGMAKEVHCDWLILPVRQTTVASASQSGWRC